MATDYAYIKYCCMTDAKIKFTAFLDHGYIGGAKNVEYDPTLLKHGGTRRGFQEIMKKVGKGDRIYVYRLNDVFNKITEFTDCIIELKRKGAELFSVHDKFTSTAIAPGWEHSLLGVNDFVQNLITAETSSEKNKRQQDYPPNIDEICASVQSGQKSLASQAEACGLSVPTLKKLVSYYEK